MKKLFFLFITSIALLTISCDADNNLSPSVQENIAGTYNRMLLTSDGQNREYIVYVPEAAAGKAEVPVLLVIHGTNQNGQIFNDNVNLWNPKADEEGFIVVYPTALVHCHYDNGAERSVTKWADGNLGETDVSKGALPLCPGEVLADDMLFFDELIEVMKADYVVDEKRFYASGFSNGAQMTARLAAQRSEVFAAVAVHAGGYSQFLPSTLAERPMSMMVTVGANDWLFANAAGLTAPVPLDENLLGNPGVAAILRPLLEINGLSNQYQYSSRQYQDKEVADFLFQNSTVGLNNSVRFILIENLAHSYTNLLIDPLWTFFEGQSIP